MVIVSIRNAIRASGGPRRPTAVPESLGGATPTTAVGRDDTCRGRTGSTSGFHLPRMSGPYSG